MSLILVNDEGALLLGKRSSRARFEPGKWDLPGGKVETREEESLSAAVVRELKEEFGLAHSGSLESVGTYRFEYPDRTVEAHYFRGLWTGAARIELAAAEFSEGGFVDLAAVEKLDLAFSHGRVLREVMPFPR